MNKSEKRLRETLTQIAELASEAVHGPGNRDQAGNGAERYDGNGEEADHSSSMQRPGCTLRSLPTRLLVRAAETATRINPVNAPLRQLARAGVESVQDPLRIAVMTQKYWGPAARTLSVSFLDTPSAELRRRIIRHLNAWAISISFAETQGTGTIRIAREPDGYWSYLGTDILHIAPDQPTMNLQDFSMSTPESEFIRVIRHEAGHTLGFPHEHMRRELVARIDPQKAYSYFLRTQGWNRATVDQQVLTPLSAASIFGTPPDETSIMCYQLPSSITRDGRPILGGDDINRTDFEFAGKIYPKQVEQQLEESIQPWDKGDEGFLEEAAAY